MTRPFVSDWSAYPNFTEEGIRYKHTRAVLHGSGVHAHPAGGAYARPMVITSRKGQVGF